MLKKKKKEDDEKTGLVTKEDKIMKLLNSPENVLMAHEPDVTKNPVVVPVNRERSNPEIEIRPLKEDVSLKNRDINNPSKIKKRRRRSRRRKKRLSNIDVSSNS